MENFTKIKDYELLSKKVYRLIKDRITKGDFKSGTKIYEIGIARKLGVSRTPVREALRELAAEGLVKIEPNLGAMVIDYSIDDLQEVLQIRRLIEGFAASIAAQKINEVELKELEKIISKMNLCIEKEDVVGYSEANAEFHDLIFKICGNKRLSKIHENLSDTDHRFRIRALRKNSGRLKYSLQEHKKIFEALKGKNSEKAESFSKEHIDKVWKNILKNSSKEERDFPQ